MKNLTIISPLLYAVLTTFLLFSNSSNAKTDLIEKLDLDQDGQISIKEAVAEPQLLAAFGKIDIDGNGLLTREELAKSKFNLIEH
ncbi:hypothetical protein [Paraglaciecola sp. L3A3]|uniref:hypothetical protein n=1 Tax=Paraglaciecola sp. L3A3 TaxID=2686358 RepID=UPI00131E572A|nr:hypothetical protein [Paraglaciecola sp. L3A3]